MINQSLYDACVVLTKSLSERGIMLAPKPGSVLQAAVTCANPLMQLPAAQHQNNVLDANQHYRNHTLTTVNSTTTEATPYEAIVKNAAEQLFVPVNAHIQYARNVVKPAVKSLFDKLSEVINQNPVREASETIEIIGYTMPSFINDDYFRDTINTYKRPCEIPLRTNFMKEMNAEEIADLLKSGANRLDKEIFSWAESSNIRAYDVWASLFGTPDTAYKRVTLSSLTAMNYYEAAGYFAIAFLMVNNIIKKRLIQNSTISSEREFEVTAESMLNYITYRLSVCMTESEKMERNNVIVIAYNKSSKTIKVVYPNYKKWVETGVSPDVLLGAFSEDATERTIDDIGKKADYFLRAWDRSSNLIQQVERRKCFNILRSRMVSETLLDFQKNSDDLEREFHRTHSMFEMELKKRINEYVDRISPDSMTNSEDLFKHCLKIVAGIRYGYTPAYVILECMMTLTKDGGIDVRESAAVAAAEYLIDYMKTQIQATKV